MNNSTSTISAGWPTNWPANSFRWLPTALLGIPILVFLVVAIFAAARPQGNVAFTPAMVVVAVLLQLVIEGIVVAIILTALPSISKFSLRQLGFYAPRPWQIGIGLIGAVAMVIVVEGGATLIQTLSGQKHEQSVVELFKHVVGTNVMWFFAIFAIVLAPFMEEVMFRVFVFNVGLRYGGFWTGAVISGLCFGAAHGDFMVLVPLALGGMILSYVYYRTGNAFSSMITHGLFNAVTVFALIFAPQLAK